MLSPVHGWKNALLLQVSLPMHKYCLTPPPQVGHHQQTKTLHPYFGQTSKHFVISLPQCCAPPSRADWLPLAGPRAVPCLIRQATALLSIAISYRLAAATGQNAVPCSTFEADFSSSVTLSLVGWLPPPSPSTVPRAAPL
eukprot:1016294-Pelagomonas_calceolata.AAC.2